MRCANSISPAASTSSVTPSSRGGCITCNAFPHRDFPSSSTLGLPDCGAPCWGVESGSSRIASTSKKERSSMEPSSKVSAATRRATTARDNYHRGHPENLHVESTQETLQLVERHRVN